MPSTTALRCVFRKLGPEDRAAFRGHLLRLGSVERLARFGGLSPRALPERVPDGALVLGVFIGETLRGVGELRVPAGGPVGEAAFSVEALFARRGLGTVLLGRLADAALRRGVGRLVLTAARCGPRMIRLAHAAGADLVRGQDGLVASLGIGRANAAAIALAELDALAACGDGASGEAVHRWQRSRYRAGAG